MSTGYTVIRTLHGAIRGVAREGSAAFYGVPYAAAPRGREMFSLPSSPVAWTDVRDATIPGPTAQVTGFADGTIPEPSVPGDDFLTVNVFIPTPPQKEALPVLVWFHGGAYIAGSPVSPWYDGASFNRHGIIVLTVGYRLGIAGFGLLPDAPPNRAIHDWSAALRWVHDNIAEFGGDPTKVTIAGQSAGAGAVLTLLDIEPAKETFSQAIACSPVFTQMTTAGASRVMREVSHLLGIPATAAALADVTKDRLDEAVWQMRNVFGKAPATAGVSTDGVALLHLILRSLEFSPILDGTLVKRPIVDGALRTADTIPLLIGSTAQEFNALVPASADLAESNPVLALETFDVGWGAATRYLRERSGYTGAALTGQLLTDLMVRSPLAFLAERRAQTWVYDFRWQGQGEVDPGWAFHCLDLPFVWNTVAAQSSRRVTGAPPAELAHNVHDAFVRFIHTGNPGWSAYHDKRAVRCFDEHSHDATDGYAAERLLGRAAANLGLTGERNDILT